jgi:hypothetical protein
MFDIVVSNLINKKTTAHASQKAAESRKESISKIQGSGARVGVRSI